MKKNNLKNQKGVSLVIALLILLVLTLLGISAISTTTFETNIAGNERLYNRAFYTSDAGVDYFFGNRNFYVSLPNSMGTVNSTGEGLPLGGDYFLINWARTVTATGPPRILEFRITAEGISPNFPTAGRVVIEAVIEAEESGPGIPPYGG